MYIIIKFIHSFGNWVKKGGNDTEYELNREGNKGYRRGEGEACPFLILNRVPVH